MEQRSPDWYAARCGKATASAVASILAKTKSGGESASRQNELMRVVCEVLTGTVEEGYTSPAMARGNDLEPVARCEYSATTGELVELVGFIDHPEIDGFGASPDGLVGDDGLVEFKCPNTATHMRYMLDSYIPADYQIQMLCQMACTGRKWCDFVSFDDRLPEGLRLSIVRFNRDEKRIAEIEWEVRRFLADRDDLVKRLRNRLQEQF